MSSTPSILLPVTLSRMWIDIIFGELDQWEDVGKFYALHARELNTVQGHRRLCSPKVGYLFVLCTGAMQLIHPIHQEEVDDFHGDDEGEIWALTGASGAVSMIVIGTCSVYQLSGKPNNWPTWLNGTQWMTS